MGASCDRLPRIAFAANIADFYEGAAMTVDRDDILFMMRFEELFRPSTDAKKFVWSEGLKALVEAGIFFDEYSLDSDERFYVNAVATYFERLGEFWRQGIVPDEIAMSWISVDMYWDLLGGILIQAREIFDAPGLWRDFEALAAAYSAAN